jgi:hypothetical protein
MESTAPYGKPVWQQLEGQCALALAQAQSHRAPQGRQGDYQDAERLLRRHVAGELNLSLVPSPEQRLWRTLTRSQHQWTRDRVRMHSQIESLLEDAHIQLATVVSDLLGVRSRRMWQALAKGEKEPARLAAMAAPPALRATPEQLRDAWRAASTLHALHRQILELFLTRLELVESQMQSWRRASGRRGNRTRTPSGGSRRFPDAGWIRPIQ